MEELYKFLYLLGQLGLPQATFVLVVILVLAKKTTLLGGATDTSNACELMAAEVARLATGQADMSRTQTDLLVAVGKLETKVDELDGQVKILVGRA